MTAKLFHIHQISIVRYRKRALYIAQRQRLGVLPQRTARGGVAHMAYRHGPVQPLQIRPAEYLPDQAHILPAALLQAVHRGNAAGLLSPVLERV